MARAGKRRAGIGDEVRGAALGDFRRSRRLVKLVERMAQDPDASFPSVLDDAELEAAYRLLGNEHVTPDAILGPHVRATVERIQHEEVALALHDTTTMSFRAGGKREELDRVSALGAQQFFSHHTLAISGDGTRRPLGHLALSIYTHTQTRGSTDRNEQDRWAEHCIRVNELVDPKRVVHVMDREADDYDLLALLVGSGSRFIVRLQYDRLLLTSSSDEPRKVREALADVTTVETREVALSRRSAADVKSQDRKCHPPREGRTARLAISAAPVVLKRPQTAGTELPPTLRVNIVRVHELDAPSGEKPVEWLLITTEPIDASQQILRIVDWYRARWVIEEFFKALKTGCAFQKRQLHDLHGLSNALAVFIPIACQLLLIRNEARDRPTELGNTVLPADQLEVLGRVARKPLPIQPTARDIYVAIAGLGGHLKHNGEPGWQVLGRGYEKLLGLTEGWNLRRRAERERPDRVPHMESECASDQ